MKKLCCILFAVSCLATTVFSEEETGAAGSLPPPEKGEMKMPELQARRMELDGKIVEVLINHVFGFEQQKSGSYRASCDWWGEGANAPQLVIIPEEGKEFFQTLAKQDNYDGGGRAVYVKVNKNSLEAIGTRYSKSKQEYKW